MSHEDSKIIDSDVCLYPICNRSEKTVALHKNSEICTVAPVNKGKRLKQLDEAIDKKFLEENIPAIIKKQAPGGLEFPKNGPIKFDGE